MATQYQYGTQKVDIREQLKSQPFKHDYEKLGSLGSACLRCELPFVWSVDHSDWTGLACSAEPYSDRELFAINKAYITTVDRRTTS